VVGRFRGDLFYRLSVFSIKLPSLRERIEDLPILANDIVSELTSELQLSYTPKIGPDFLDALRRYHWPGNVRELRNVLERSLILSSTETLTPDLLTFHTPPPDDSSLSLHLSRARSLEDILKEVKHLLVQDALKRTGGNKSKAARLLGVSRYFVMDYVNQK
jgi:transcriptional regulator with PAS, ATPase and Fis domain